MNVNKIHTKYGIKWVEGPIKVIDIWAGKIMFNRNIEENIQKVKNMLNMSKARNLTIKGKITLVRSQAMPILLYPFSVLKVCDETLEKVDKVFLTAYGLWPNTRFKKSIIQTMGDGGLKMPDIKTMVTALHG